MTGLKRVKRFYKKQKYKLLAKLGPWGMKKMQKIMQDPEFQKAMAKELEKQKTK